MLSFARTTHRSSFRTLGLSLGVATLCVLAGCASMSEGECLTADWSRQGFEDGRRGYPASRVLDHREACASVGVAPDMLLYRKGYDQGLVHYCTPANAIAEGRAGRSYGNVCPARLEGQFLTYYRQGRAAHDAQQRVDRLNDQSRRLQRQLDQEKKADARRRLRAQLRDLDHQLRRARGELAEIDRRLP